MTLQQEWPGAGATAVAANATSRAPAGLHTRLCRAPDCGRPPSSTGRARRPRLLFVRIPRIGAGVPSDRLLDDEGGTLASFVPWEQVVAAISPRCTRHPWVNRPRMPISSWCAARAAHVAAGREES